MSYFKTNKFISNRLKSNTKIKPSNNKLYTSKYNLKIKKSKFLKRLNDKIFFKIKIKPVFRSVKKYFRLYQMKKNKKIIRKYKLYKKLKLRTFMIKTIKRIKYFMNISNINYNSKQKYLKQLVLKKRYIIDKFQKYKYVLSHLKIQKNLLKIKPIRHYKLAFIHPKFSNRFNFKIKTKKQKQKLIARLNAIHFLNRNTFLFKPSRFIKRNINKNKFKKIFNLIQFNFGKISNTKYNSIFEIEDGVTDINKKFQFIQIVKNKNQIKKSKFKNKYFWLTRLSEKHLKKFTITKNNNKSAIIIKNNFIKFNQYWQRYLKQAYIKIYKFKKQNKIRKFFPLWKIRFNLNSPKKKYRKLFQTNYKINRFQNNSEIYDNQFARKKIAIKFALMNWEKNKKSALDLKLLKFNLISKKTTTLQKLTKLSFFNIVNLIKTKSKSNRFLSKFNSSFKNSHFNNTNIQNLIPFSQKQFLFNLFEFSSKIDKSLFTKLDKNNSNSITFNNWLQIKKNQHKLLKLTNRSFNKKQISRVFLLNLLLNQVKAVKINQQFSFFKFNNFKNSNDNSNRFKKNLNILKIKSKFVSNSKFKIQLRKNLLKTSTKVLNGWGRFKKLKLIRSKIYNISKFKQNYIAIKSKKHFIVKKFIWFKKNKKIKYPKFFYQFRRRQNIHIKRLINYKFCNKRQRLWKKLNSLSHKFLRVKNQIFNIMVEKRVNKNFILFLKTKTFSNKFKQYLIFKHINMNTSLKFKQQKIKTLHKWLKLKHYSLPIKIQRRKYIKLIFNNKKQKFLKTFKFLNKIKSSKFIPKISYNLKNKNKKFSNKLFNVQKQLNKNLIKKISHNHNKLGLIKLKLMKSSKIKQFNTNVYFSPIYLNKQNIFSKYQNKTYKFSSNTNLLLNIKHKNLMWNFILKTKLNSIFKNSLNLNKSNLLNITKFEKFYNLCKKTQSKMNYKLKRFYNFNKFYKLNLQKKNRFKRLGLKLQRIKFPWLNILVNRSALYKTLTYKANKRKIIFYKTKRTRIYKMFSLFNLNEFNPIKFFASKKGGNRYFKYRLNLLKVILPFYGKLKHKQLKNIWEKFKYVKTHQIGRSSKFYNKLNTSLYVLTQQLEWAPNTFWAQVLIKKGYIYISKPQNSLTTVETNLKNKLLFPLNFSKINFLNTNLTDIKITPKITPYTNLKSNEIIQINPRSKILLNKFFYRQNRIYKKFLPNYIEINSNRTSAILVNNPKILATKTRIKKSFIRNIID